MAKEDPDVTKTLAPRKKASTAVARRKEESRQYGILQERVSPTLARQMTQLSSKGASIWLTALPLWKHGLHLSKSDFRDTLTLRYGWQLQVPATCGCGELFTTTHTMCRSRLMCLNIILISRKMYLSCSFTMQLVFARTRGFLQVSERVSE